MPIILLSSYEEYTDENGDHRSRRIKIESQYPWEGQELLQGGEGGLVIANGSSYTTAFMEAFIDGTFIRGEGITIHEAETNAWNKYLARNECEEHSWVARGYQNGAGFCSKCNTFSPKVFSGEELGQFCKVCNVGTTYSWDIDAETKIYTFFCREHEPKHKY